MAVEATTTPALLARLEGLELKARTVVEGLAAGLHRSPFRGFSNEFAEHREYVPGDDLRYVDWKIFGKSDRYYLKQFDEETNFICQFVVDTSESMSYRSAMAPWSKWECAQTIAAALSYLVLQQQDAVGLSLFASELRGSLRPGGSGAQWGDLCAVLDRTRPESKTAIGQALHQLAESMSRRGLVVLISDLFGDPAEIRQGLRHLKHRRQDVLVVHVIDPAEEEFPFHDPGLFVGMEHEGRERIDPRGLRAAYRREFAAFLTEMRAEIESLRFDYFYARTDHPLEGVLASFLQRRRMRRSR